MQTAADRMIGGGRIRKDGYLVRRSGWLCRNSAPARAAALHIGVITARVVAVVPVLLWRRAVLGHDRGLLRRVCRPRIRIGVGICIRIWVGVGVGRIRVVVRVGVIGIHREAEGEGKPRSAPAATPAAAMPTTMPPTGIGRRGERQRAKAQYDGKSQRPQGATNKARNRPVHRSFLRGWLPDLQPRYAHYSTHYS